MNRDGAISEVTKPASDPNGPTGKLCRFLGSLSLPEVPEEVVARVELLILDGLGCGLLGSHLPWSSLAVETLTSLEGAGDATVWGWDRRLPPTSAALLNGTFIQGLELDDYHQRGPLHSAACVLPALLATAERIGGISGGRFLEAAIAGYEVGPRVGMAMGGLDMVSRGWHSGAIYGAVASSAATAKLYQLDAGGIEDAIGIGATQASGLMSAQYEAMVKRMHSGMAARNGLLAAALARNGFVGIKRVLEREYGGLIPTFCAGGPSYIEAVTDQLGEHWEAARISVKPPYACAGACHSAIEAAISLRESEGVRPPDVRSIRIGLAHAMYHHHGFKLKRPAEAIGAQMNMPYAVAVALLDGEGFVRQFGPERLDCQDVWDLIEKTTVRWDEDIDRLGPDARFTTRLSITMADGRTLEREIRQPWGAIARPLTADEIRKKFHLMASLVVDEDRAARIEDVVLNLRSCGDVAVLLDLLGPAARQPY